jgi:outer membrane lipoprotein-sorting protein
VKRFLFLLIVLSMLLSACSFSKQPQKTMWEPDPEYVKELETSINQSRARRNGDTYCEKCDKYIEGKVRICTYCGQYISSL